MSVTFGPVVLGTAALAGLFSEVPETEALLTLNEAWAEGVRWFDTAPHYGAGMAEQRLGRFLSGLPEPQRAQARVSTKVGRLLVPGDTPGGEDGPEFADGTGMLRMRDYSAKGVLRSVEESLERIGADRLDLVLVHDPDDHLDQTIDEAVPALIELRDRGRIGAVGAGMNDASGLSRLVAATGIDCVLEAGRYTLLDRTAERELLPLCAERGVTVLAAGLFNSGILADPRPGAHFDYAPAEPGMLRAAQAMAAACARHEVPLVAAALQHARRHGAVDSIVIGARSPLEVRDCLQGLSVPVPPELWDELDALAVLR